MTTDTVLKKILERDYYVPDVSELCIGFDYYQLGEYNGVIIIGHGIIESGFHFMQAIDTFKINKLLAKKLDSNDIINLGFKKEVDKDSFGNIIGEVFVNNDFEIRTMNDFELFIINQVGQFESAFFGKIKNKNELKKLLEQISI